MSASLKVPSQPKIKQNKKYFLFTCQLSNGIHCWQAHIGKTFKAWNSILFMSEERGQKVHDNTCPICICSVQYMTEKNIHRAQRKFIGSLICIICIVYSYPWLGQLWTMDQYAVWTVHCLIKPREIRNRSKDDVLLYLSAPPRQNCAYCRAFFRRWDSTTSVYWNLLL